MVVVIGAVLIATLGLEIPLRLEALPVFVLTMAGLLGLGFVIGGATLVFKRTNALAELVGI